MTQLKKSSHDANDDAARGTAEHEETVGIKLVRRTPGRTVAQAESAGTLTAKAVTKSGKMVLETNMLTPFRGFTQTPEEGQRLSRTSFTDTPLLGRVAKK